MGSVSVTHEVLLSLKTNDPSDDLRFVDLVIECDTSTVPWTYFLCSGTGVPIITGFTVPHRPSYLVFLLPKWHTPHPPVPPTLPSEVS